MLQLAEFAKVKTSQIAKLVLVFLAFFLAAALFELIARLVLPKPENLAKLESSSLFLYENKPNSVFPYQSLNEFDNEIKINSYGFRDEEFRQEKPKDVFRIAVLGDSQEEALQVTLADTWQKVMARELSSALSIEAESYNFGVSGYGTDQEWLTLPEKVWQFLPDMVILAFSPNDVGDTYKNKLIRLVGDKIEVISRKERTGGNFLGRIARETYIYHLAVRASANNQLTKKMMGYIRSKIFGFAQEEKFFLSDAQLVQGPFEVIASQKSPPGEVLETWEVVKALIRDMKKQSDEHGAGFLVTINIPRAQVQPEDWQFLASTYKLDLGTSSPYEINEVIGKFAQEEGIDFYDPRLDAIKWKDERGDLHFLRDAHFNINGNLFMGTKVAEFILDKELVGR